MTLSKHVPLNFWWKGILTSPSHTMYSEDSMNTKVKKKILVLVAKKQTWETFSIKHQEHLYPHKANLFAWPSSYFSLIVHLDPMVDAMHTWGVFINKIPLPKDTCKGHVALILDPRLVSRSSWALKPLHIRNFMIKGGMTRDFKAFRRKIFGSMDKVHT